jgi:hypothetical protein
VWNRLSYRQGPVAVSVCFDRALKHLPERNGLTALRRLGTGP